MFASNIFGDLHFYRTVPWHHVKGVAEALAALGWRVVRYDVRGMGSSDRAVSDLSFDARVMDLEAVVTRLGFERFALAGVDIGAATAVACAVRHAPMVSDLVLLSPWMSGADMSQIVRRFGGSGPLTSSCPSRPGRGHRRACSCALADPASNC